MHYFTLATLGSQITRRGRIMQNIALLGAGFIGHVHAKSLATNPRVEFTYVYDTDESRARELAAAYGASFAPLEEILASDRVGAVLIATSTNTHAELIEAAAQAGKAVFCEKPIDLSYEVAERAATTAREAGVPVMIDFCRRFDPAYASLKKAVEKGEIGDIELIQMSTRGPSLPPISYLASSGGQMRDQNIHFFDLLCWITGLEPVSVYAEGSALVDPEVAEVGDVDTSIAILRMSNGALCQIDAQRRIAYGYDERIEISGTKEMMEAGRQQTGWTKRYGQGSVTSEGLDAGWFERIEHTFAPALDEFVSALEEGREPSAGLTDGLRAQRIADAATESLKTGLPVTISYDA